MRGSYKSARRRVIVGSGYKIAIGVVVAIAIALVMILLAYLPATNDTIIQERKIVSIEDISDGIGVGSDLSLVYVSVTYSDGTTESVALSNMVHEGLDLTVAGQNNVVLSYGGFEQTIKIDVQDVDCVVKYESSVGGSIKGELVQSVANGGSTSTVIAVPETGYVFAGWKDGYPYASRKDYGVVENKTLIAVFEKAKYTVRFYYNDGTVASEEKVLFGESATRAPLYGSDPRMEVYGYTFNSWIPNDYSSIDRDLNIYPEYIKTATDVLLTVPNDVYGNPMGSVDLNEQGYYPHNKTATILATPHNSRKFSHWLITDIYGTEHRLNAESTETVAVGVGGQELTFTSTKSGNTAEDYQLSFVPNSDITQISIKAIFAYSSSDITFLNYQQTDNNGIYYVATDLPFGKPLSYVTEQYFGSNGLPVPDEVNGLEFLGWYTLGDPTQTVITKDATFEQPTTVVAKWKRKQYTLQFMYDDPITGQTGIWHTSAVTYQDTFASGTNGGLPSVNPERENYNFVGWADALTGVSVDDKTQLYYDSKYALTEDFKNGIIKFIPIWEAKRHRLYVQLNGSGKATLIINEGKYSASGESLTERVEVNGETTIFEDNTYALYVEALEGFELSSSYWEYNKITPAVKTYLKGTYNDSFALHISSDNIITVNFAVKKINVNVTNGDGLYAGFIEFNKGVYEGHELTFTVDYNTSVSLKIISDNPVYSISDILVDGQSIGNVFDNTQVYTLILPSLKTDVSVEIVYYTQKYTVALEKLTGGTVYATDIFDLEQENPYVASDGYAYGDQIYLRIKANSGEDFRNYISSVKINGLVCDIFADTINDVTLHNWYVNGVSTNVQLNSINGEYYYVYGEGHYNVDGQDVVLVYGEDLRGVASVFVKTEIGEDDIFTYLPKENHLSIYDAIATDLDIATRSIFNTLVRNDGRVTQLDIAINVKGNYEISIGFRPIKYNVTATGGEGTIDISDENPSYKDTVVVTASPSAGYYVDGYYLNGVYYNADCSKQGEDYAIILEDIEEDMDIEVLFLSIQYRVVFIHDNFDSNLGRLYIDEKVLNNSIYIQCDYHQSVTATVSASNGYRISEVYYIQNGVEYTEKVHFNMTEYRFTAVNVTDTIVVYLKTATITVDIAENAYVLDIGNNSLNTYTVSAEYVKADASHDNTVFVKANYGYSITSIAVYTKDGTVILDSDITADASGRAEYEFVIPANTFTAGDNVIVSVVTVPHVYNLTTIGEGEGSISPSKAILYGENETVTVTAYRNCYISMVYVNGEEISFGSYYWYSLTKDSNTSKYTSAVFSFVAEQDITLKVVFARNTYKIAVDESSVNGTTTLSVNKNDENEEGNKDVAGIADGSKSSYVPHGWFVSINMSADAGYHIAGLLINDVVMELQYSGNDINEYRSATYIYKGNVVGNSAVGAEGRINVKVIYEINKYGFVYSIINASQNFGSDVSGTLTANYQLTDNRYYGITHGSNFYFNVNPAVANGYYLKQIRIFYKSVYDSEVRVVTHTPGDSALSDVTTRGGSVWFNRFLETTDGVTADIERIEVTFDRNLYTVELLQYSSSDTGTMRIEFRHSSSDVEYIFMYDTFGNTYRYKSGIFYHFDGSSYEDSGITLVNKSGTYVFTDGVVDYTILAEHGLRYNIYVTPTIGYERISFYIDGNDALSRVSDNRYSTNLDRSLVFEVEYRIITFDIEYLINVNDKNRTGKVSPNVIKNYADIYVRIVSGYVYYLDYTPVFDNHNDLFELEVGEAGITLSQSGKGYKLGYGACVQFVMYPKFNTSGYYLTSFVFTDTDITDRVVTRTLNINGVETQCLVYGGANPDTGYAITDDLHARSTFDIVRYKIYTSIQYEEEITGETINYLKEESNLSIAWGDNANIKVNIGTGFTLSEIIVKRGDKTSYVNLIDSANNDAFDEQMYYHAYNSTTREYRDYLRVRDVVSDVYVTATVARKEYTVRYVINGVENLYEISTDYNENHIGYPKNTISSLTSADISLSNNVYQLTAYHYDEITVTITPKNGYALQPIVTNGRREYKAIIKAVAYNESTKQWEQMNDNAGNPISTELNLSTLSGDIKYFTFHPSTSIIANTYISTDIEIELTVAVKKYDVTTMAVFTDGASADNKNNTTISWDIKDKEGDSQYAVALSRDIKQFVLETEHHGTLNYYIKTPKGYSLSQIMINGIVWKGLEYTWTDDLTGELKYPIVSDDGRQTSYSSSILSYKIEFNSDAKDEGYYQGYIYTITYTVNDTLLSGAYGSMQSVLNVYMTFAPIVIEINAYINNNPYENSVYNGISGVSDDETVTINIPSTIRYFDTLNINPRIFEGYEVQSLKILSGAIDSVNPNESATNYSVSSPELRKSFYINMENIPYLNLLTGNRYLHVYYSTDIISYQSTVDVYGYSFDDGVVKTQRVDGKEEQSTEFSEGYVSYVTALGTVNVTVTRDGVVQPFPSISGFKYGSDIRIEAYANAGYVLYGIYETETINGIAIENAISSGVRGLHYTTEQYGSVVHHVITYKVNSLGDRQFKVVFKQETQVTVYIPNPYKYDNGYYIGDINYYSYVDLKAKQNGVLVENSNPEAKNVCDTYIYNVLVGNYFALIYTDMYRKTGQTDYSFCYRTENNGKVTYEAAAMGKDSVFTDGVGMVITRKTELYLYNNIQARITFEKETNGAVEDAVGGTVGFPNISNPNSYIEPASGYYSNSNTIMNKELIIKVTPNKNYVLSNFYIRRRDLEKSQTNGRIEYYRGTNEWRSYTESFFMDGSNGSYVMYREDQSDGTIFFHIYMCGDMELKFEFYRVYELSYALDLANEEISYSDPGIILSDVVNNAYGDMYKGDGFYVQYNSSFYLTAPKTPENYVFVGWYLNGQNTYLDLDRILPKEGILSRQFLIDKSLEGLQVNGLETDTIELIAIYQPVISVVMINESYFSSGDSWNSWTSGYLRAEYYNFDTVKVADSTTVKTLNNTANSDVLLSSLNYGKLYDNEKWLETIYNVTDVANKRIYSSMHEFKVLYESITNYDLVGNNWEDGKITFRIASLPIDLKFIGWQYYDWKEGKYKNITYKYPDANYGIDPSTNEITKVDYKFEEYTFALKYMFSKTEEGEWAMPNAISQSDGSNKSMDRPLIIRPNLHKIANVELSQIAYIDRLNGDYTTEFFSIIHPEINTTPSTEIYPNTIADNKMSATFDYGDKISLKFYNAFDEQEEIRNHPSTEDDLDYDYCYRFIGWRLYWKAPTDANPVYRFIHIQEDNSIADYELELSYMFKQSPPSDTIQLEAVYIMQFRQDFYSYNVARSDAGYEEANGYARSDAPTVSISVVESQVPFETYNPVSGKIDSKNLQYKLQYLTNDGHALQYLMDVGTTYNLLNHNERLSNVDADADDYSQNTAGRPDSNKLQGYDPDFDLFYKWYENRREQVYSFGSDNRKIYTVGQQVRKVEIQYSSRAVIVFTNMMYGAGVTIPSELSRYLNNGIYKDMTIWDASDVYTNTQLDLAFGNETTTNNGVVVLEFRLVNVQNFSSAFNYALNGFNPGRGFMVNQDLSYTYKNHNGILTANGSNLFNPSDASYRRFIIVDFNDGYLDGGSLIFGNPNYSGPYSKYSTVNTGDGTSAYPYQIWNRAQFINVSGFFYANDNTCTMTKEDGTVVQTNFKLFADILLQDVPATDINTIDPTGGTTAWTPLCYAEGGLEELGFDGIFDGDNHILDGIAAYAGGNPVAGLSKTTNINYDSGFDYSGLKGYGIFGVINRGTVKNLYIGDAFITLNDALFENIGILTAKAYNATITNVKFAENVSHVLMSRKLMTTLGGTRITMESNAQRMGMLAGYVSGGTINNVEIITNGSYRNKSIDTSKVPTANLYIHSSGSPVLGNSVTGVGMLIGYVEGTATRKIEQADIDKKDSIYEQSDLGKYINSATVTNVKYTGTNNAYVQLNVGGSSSLNVGGLIGTISNGVVLTTASITAANIQIGKDDPMSTTSIAGGLVGGAYNAIVRSSSVASNNVADRTQETKGVLLYSKESTGGIIGYQEYRKLENVFAESTTETNNITGIIRMRGQYAGGIVGNLSKGTVRNCTLYGPTSSTGVATRLMYDLNGSTSSGTNLGGIVGNNQGLVHECSITGSSGGGSYDTGYQTITGTAIYVYHSKNRDHNQVKAVNGAVSNSLTQSTLANSAQSVMGRVSVGGIAGRIYGGQVYNSFLNYTRITVNLDTLAYGENTEDEYSGHNLIISAGGIGGTIVGAASENGIADEENNYEDGSNVGFTDEIELNKDVTYGSRVQSCYTTNTSIIVANRIWLDHKNASVNDAKTEMGANSVTIAGVVGSIDGFAGQYIVNTCYSYNDYFTRQIAAFGLNNSTSDDKASTSYGWYLGDGNEYVWGLIKPSGSKQYFPIRVGLRVDGGIFGVVGGEFIDDLYTRKGKFYGSNYCWCYKNTATENKSQYDINSGDFLLDNKGTPHYRRAIEHQEYSNTSVHKSWNVACPNPSYDLMTSRDDMRITGMEAYHNANQSITDRVSTLPGSKIGDFNVLFGGGFVGVLSSTLGGSTDGRVYRTDPKTGRLLVARVFAANPNQDAWRIEDELITTISYNSYLNGTKIPKTGGKENEYYDAYSKYLVKGQSDAIQNGTTPSMAEQTKKID